MSQVKAGRIKKKQLGQFMTPVEICDKLLEKVNFTINDKVLEPSFGCGNFLIRIIEKFIELYEGDVNYKLTQVLNNNVWGIELDEHYFNLTIEAIKNKWGYIPEKNNLIHGDFLLEENLHDFNWIIGNPPFGGTINIDRQKELDKRYGKRNNLKIKLETYSFFIIKSIELLIDNGKLLFIASDTFLSIKTMSGLRQYLMLSGFNKIQSLDFFSEETNYPMVIFKHLKSNIKDYVIVNNFEIYKENMELTGNFSWFIDNKYSKYFKGPKLSNYIIGSGGMTTGKNEYFLRDIKDNTITEEYDFNFFEDPIKLENEILRAKNNKISDTKKNEILLLEKERVTRRNVNISKKQIPIEITLPNQDYKPYNKATSDIIYSAPSCAIYWKDDGDACYTFKKNGGWYLGGVGGKNFFLKEGITWQLISASIKARYLPEGYILDNSSPIAILREGINKNELYFILGWLLTDLCNSILKNVINHTKNIQSKDVERLPYPFWVEEDLKSKAIDLIKKAVYHKINTGNLSLDKQELEKLFYFK